jgi:hypothetical protein
MISLMSVFIILVFYHLPDKAGYFPMWLMLLKSGMQNREVLYLDMGLLFVDRPTGVGARSPARLQRLLFPG